MPEKKTAQSKKGHGERDKKVINDTIDNYIIRPTSGPRLIALNLQ